MLDTCGIMDVSDRAVSCDQPIEEVRLEDTHYGAQQRTLADAVPFDGIGVHSGLAVQMLVTPADIDHGIVFCTAKKVFIPARVSSLKQGGAALCTVICNQDGDRVQTVEHLMAAFAACGIDNALVHLSHDELPIMDGSAKPFIDKFIKTGLKQQTARRSFLTITQEWECHDDKGNWIKFSPLSAKETSTITAKIDFDALIPAIGKQEFTLDVTPASLRGDIMNCRTFGLEAERRMAVEKGLGRGASMENTLLFDENGLMNADNFRHVDECIRHKILDMIGDLYIAGWPIVGHISAYRPNHALNGQALQGLMDSGAVIIG